MSSLRRSNPSRTVVIALAASLWALGACSGTPQGGDATGTGTPTANTAPAPSGPSGPSTTGATETPTVEPIATSPEVLATYVGTAISSGDRAGVKAVFTDEAAASVDEVIDAIPAGSALEPPKCDSAGNSSAVHCTMMVTGARFAVEMSAAQDPASGGWRGTSLSYGSTD